MKILLATILILTANTAAATEYCLVKRKNGEPANCFKTIAKARPIG